MIDKIEHDIIRLINHQKYNGLVLNIHPFIAAYLQKGFPSIQQKWFLNHKKWIKILPRDAYQYLQYRFYDKKGKALK